MTDYRFITIWKFNIDLDKVYAAIHDADHYHIWWKGQSKVETIRKGDNIGLGAVRRFRTRSFLPYSLVYDGTVNAIEPMRKIEGTTQGDLKGHGVWLFEHSDGITTTTYIWNVRTTSRWMNLIAPIAKPFFEWNHNLVMKWGGKGLAKYLQCDLLA